MLVAGSVLAILYGADLAQWWSNMKIKGMPFLKCIKRRSDLTYVAVVVKVSLATFTRSLTRCACRALAE